MYAVTDRRSSMTASSRSLLLDLPAELRGLVYSYIILPPQERKHEQNTRQCFEAVDTYHERRKTCHEAARSLSLVSKFINSEVEPLFHKHTTMIMAQPGHESTPQSTNDKLDNTSPSTMAGIGHIEFDLLQTQNDVKDGFVDIREQLSAINGLLRNHLQHLPGLATVTFKMAVSDALTNNSLDHDFDFANTSNTHRQVATQLPEATSWDYSGIHQRSTIDYCLEEGKMLNQYAHGLGFALLPTERWACTKILYMRYRPSQQACLLHEVVFEKKEMKNGGCKARECTNDGGAKNENNCMQLRGGEVLDEEEDALVQSAFDLSDIVMMKLTNSGL